MQLTSSEFVIRIHLVSFPFRGKMCKSMQLFVFNAIVNFPCDTVDLAFGIRDVDDSQISWMHNQKPNEWKTKKSSTSKNGIRNSRDSRNFSLDVIWMQIFHSIRLLTCAHHKTQIHVGLRIRCKAIRKLYSVKEKKAAGICREKTTKSSAVKLNERRIKRWSEKKQHTTSTF